MCIYLIFYYGQNKTKERQKRQTAGHLALETEVSSVEQRGNNNRQSELVLSRCSNPGYLY